MPTYAVTHDSTHQINAKVGSGLTSFMRAGQCHMSSIHPGSVAWPWAIQVGPAAATSECFQTVDRGNQRGQYDVWVSAARREVFVSSTFGPSNFAAASHPCSLRLYCPYSKGGDDCQPCLADSTGALSCCARRKWQPSRAQDQKHLTSPSHEGMSHQSQARRAEPMPVMLGTLDLEYLFPAKEDSIAKRLPSRRESPGQALLVGTHTGRCRRIVALSWLDE
ncbi:hypothetical protein LY76DRAFT_169630 [Colletotrichum caudatum]|nr:hypothetical protein LY76DRAFT_169630 [Colletotrichum caudatum]